MRRSLKRRARPHLTQLLNEERGSRDWELMLHFSIRPFHCSREFHYERGIGEDGVKEASWNGVNRRPNTYHFSGRTADSSENLGRMV